MLTCLDATPTEWRTLLLAYPGMEAMAVIANKTASKGSLASMETLVNRSHREQDGPLHYNWGRV